MKNKKVFLYCFLTFIMVLFPLFNIFSFIPMVILYKKFGIKTYSIVSFIFLIFSTFFLFSFVGIISVLVSFIFIKMIESNKEGYKILLFCAFCMTALIVFEFLFIKFYYGSLDIFLDSINEIFKNFEPYSNSLKKDVIKEMLNIFPAISFGLSYAVCNFGYLFLLKKVYKVDRKFDDIIFPIDLKFLLFSFFIIAFMVISNFNQGDNFYRIFLICYNLILIVVEIMLIQGFVRLNQILKEKFGKIMSNIISIISVFLFISYIIYFVYGIYISVLRGVKWEKS